MKNWACIGIAWCVVTASQVVAAEPLSDDEMNVVPPEGQTEAATFRGRPVWCPKRFPGEVFDKGRLRRLMMAFQGGYHIETSEVLEAAEQVCQWADDPTWQKQTMYLVQAWMNVRHLSQDDAEKEITESIAKLQAERIEAARPKTDEDRMAFRDDEIGKIAAAPGVDTASITTPVPWCDRVTIPSSDRWDTSRIERTFKAGYERYLDLDQFALAALHVCQRPGDRTWKLEGQAMVQEWMNITGLSQAEAVESLRSRIQIDKFKAEHAALCKGIEVPPEAGGEAEVVGKAERDVLGCNGAPLWEDPGRVGGTGVGFYLDEGLNPEHETTRLYWLFQYVAGPYDDDLGGTDTFKNRVLLHYAVAAWDFEHIDSAALDQQLSAAPYNDYARTIAHESVGKLRNWRKRYEVAIDKLAKGDEDYKAILRDAAKQGFDAWQKSIAPWKAEVDRAHAFEKKLSAPSRKVLKGCSADLTKDVAKLIKSYKLAEYTPLRTKLATDPIASILLPALALCYSAEGTYGIPGAIQDIMQHARDLHGPRGYAFYAIIDTFTKVAKDRPRLRIDLSNFTPQSESLLGLNKDFDLSGGLPTDPDNTYTKGVVQSVEKTADGLKVTFKKVTLKFPDMACTDDTSHPLRVNSDGRIEYYRNCKATGRMLSQDETSPPIVIAPGAAAGVKPGVFLVAAGAGGTHYYVVYTKRSSSDKKLTSFLGFPL
ncbi:MAG TPA: hypothetical protein VMJ10_04120 [Kofleriaceae bacterium]|nr:hypothetical protein [Kofleriaceae bacterium]